MKSAKNKPIVVFHISVIKGRTHASYVTYVALLKAQNLLFSAKNLFEEDRIMLGGEA